MRVAFSVSRVGLMELSTTESGDGNLPVPPRSEFTMGVMFWMSKSGLLTLQHHPETCGPSIVRH